MHLPGRVPGPPLQQAAQALVFPAEGKPLSSLPRFYLLLQENWRKRHVLKANRSDFGVLLRVLTPPSPSKAFLEVDALGSALPPLTGSHRGCGEWGVGSGPRLHPTTAGSWCASPLASESTCEMGRESQLAIEEAFCTVLGWRLLQKLLLQCLCHNSCLCHLVVSQLHLQVVL